MRVPAGFWIGFAMILGASGVAGTSLAIVLLSGGIGQPDKKLRLACDHVVEALLSTHDLVELERDRILVQALRCGVENRIDDWPAGRSGGLLR